LRVLFTAVGSALFRKVAEKFQKAPKNAGWKGGKMAKNVIYHSNFGQNLIFDHLKSSKSYKFKV